MTLLEKRRLRRAVQTLRSLAANKYGVASVGCNSRRRRLVVYHYPWNKRRPWLPPAEWHGYAVETRTMGVPRSSA